MSAAWLYRLLRPPAPEPLPLSHLRRAARAELFAMPCLAAINLAYWYLRRHEDRAVPELGNHALAVNLGALAVCALTNLWLLRGTRTERQYRHGAFITSACLVLSTMVATWATGTPTNAPAATLAIIAGARVYYDQRIGVVTLLLAIGVHLGLLALVIAGYLPPHLEPMAWGAQPASTTWLIWCGVRIVIFYTLAWLVASMIANSFRTSEHALRVARDGRERMRAHVEGLQQLGRDSVSASVAHPLVGRLSGNVLGGIYELHELLGRGGMGEVYQGVRLVDGRDVAIKVLHAEFGSAPRMLDRFRREAELAARLTGRHVPEVLEHGISPEGDHFIAMELLRGEDLAAYLRRRGPLPASELLPLVDGLAQALDAAHDRGIVHRDLKPQNVFLVGTELDASAVKLLDFGIARLYEVQGTQAGTQLAVLGTPGFLAPEQARGEVGKIGPATDVFALGAVIYRALTGRHAFPSRDLAMAVFESVFHHPAPPSEHVAGLAPDVDLVLAIALAKAPADRYQRASELASDLRAAIAGRLPTASRDRAQAVISSRRRSTLAESLAPSEVAAVTELHA